MDVCNHFVYNVRIQIIKTGPVLCIPRFLNLLRTLRRRAMRKGKSIQSNIHEYRKLRSSILSGYMPGRICEGYVRFPSLNFGIPTQKIRASKKNWIWKKKLFNKSLFFNRAASGIKKRKNRASEGHALKDPYCGRIWRKLKGGGQFDARILNILK